jgi:hypothetical protein
MLEELEAHHCFSQVVEVQMRSVVVEEALRVLSNSVSLSKRTQYTPMLLSTYMMLILLFQ